jgi:hypothetical protein
LPLVTLLSFFFIAFSRTANSWAAQITAALHHAGNFIHCKRARGVALPSERTSILVRAKR